MEEDDVVVHVPIEDRLNLHAFAPRDVPDVVNDYLDAAWERGLVEVRLIHGRGIGVQHAVVHRVLSRHPRVAEFWDAPGTQLGATIARLHPPVPASPGGAAR